MTLLGSLAEDHCFVMTSRATEATLVLLNNVSIGLSTDHAYTLHLRLESSKLASTVPSATSAPSPIRYRVGNFSDERVR